MTPPTASCFTLFSVGANDKQQEMLDSLASALSCRYAGIDATDDRRAELLGSPCWVLAFDHEDGSHALSLARPLAHAGLLTFIYCDAPTVSLALRAGRAGIRDVFSPETSQQLLVASLSGYVHAELQNCQQRKCQLVVREKVNALSPLERSVLRLLLDGYINKVIATRLKVSSRTVEAKRQRLMKIFDKRHVCELFRCILKYDDLARIAALDEGFKGQSA